MSRAVLNGSVASVALLAFAVLADETDGDADRASLDGATEYAAIDRSPETCISTPRIRSTEIIDDQTILFYMRGGKVYSNLLDYQCHGLETNDLFRYETRGTRLCSKDRVTVMMRFGTGFMDGMTCSLGGFHPLTREEAELLELEPEARQSLQNTIRTTAVEPRDQAPVEAPAEAPASDLPDGPDAVLEAELDTGNSADVP